MSEREEKENSQIGSGCFRGCKECDGCGIMSCDCCTCEDYECNGCKKILCHPCETTNCDDCDILLCKKCLKFCYNCEIRHGYCSDDPIGWTSFCDNCLKLCSKCKHWCCSNCMNVEHDLLVCDPCYFVKKENSATIEEKTSEIA